MKRDARAVKEALLRQLPQVIEALFGANAAYQGHEWRLGSMTGERGHSLAIEAQDPVRLGLWIDHNPGATGKAKGDVLDLIAEARLVDLGGALAWSRDFLGWSERSASPQFTQPFTQAGATLAPAPPRSLERGERSSPTQFAQPRTQTGIPLAPAHPRSLERAAHALKEHPAALAYLEGRGLAAATVTHFHLGLYSYPGQAGEVRDALSYPLLDAQGVPRKRWLRSRIPGVTQGVDEKRKDWAGGQPTTYWVTPAEGRTRLLVCEGAKDGWWLWQSLQGSPLAAELCVITSTHGSVVPEEWKDPRFWQPWDAVYLAQDADAAGDAMALRVKRLTSRDVRRVRVPEGYGKDWTDFFQQGQTLEGLVELCQQAPIMSESLESVPAPGEVPPRPGLYAATPVDVSGAFVGGHLYVPFRVLERSVEEGERLLQRYRTYVLRSDGKVCTFDYLPAPKNTPREDLVLALDDGTVISKAPVVDEARSTLSLAAITRFRDAQLAGRSALHCTPGELLEGVHAHLKRVVVLPHPEDYALLTFVAAVSYVQQIFERYLWC